MPVWVSNRAQSIQPARNTSLSTKEQQNPSNSDIVTAVCSERMKNGLSYFGTALYFQREDPLLWQETGPRPLR